MRSSAHGGVATSGLEMSQNSLRINWTRDEVDEKLKNIMADIHDSCITFGKQDDGYIDYVKGANIAGFVKVADAISLYCDPGAISQIITNLIMNSLHHAFAQDEVGHIVIAANITGETLHLAYSDDGQGIDTEILSRLFD